MFWPFLVAALAGTAGTAMQTAGAAQRGAAPPSPGRSMAGVTVTPEYLTRALAQADEEAEELGQLYEQDNEGVLSYLRQVLGGERPQIPNQFLGVYQ